MPHRSHNIYKDSIFPSGAYSSYTHLSRGPAKDCTDANKLAVLLGEPVRIAVVGLVHWCYRCAARTHQVVALGDVEDSVFVLAEVVLAWC
jgi:hypothetical protein